MIKTTTSSTQINEGWVYEDLQQMDLITWKDSTEDPTSTHDKPCHCLYEIS